MSKRKIKKINSIDKTIDVSGSKAYSMHVLAIASLACGKTYIDNILINDDFLTFINALEKIGVESDFTYSSQKKSKDITIIGTSGHIAPYIGEIHIQNSSTSLNFLMSMLTLGSGVYFVSTGDKLKERPIDNMLSILRTMDVSIKSKNDHYPPVLINAMGFNGGQLHFTDKVYHQIISSLLITAPYAKKPLEIYFENGIDSPSYIDITLDSMKMFGVHVERDGDKYFKVNNNKYQAPDKINIEPDATIAAHFFAIAAIIGGRARVNNINYSSSKQEHIKFVDILEQMGCNIKKESNFIEVSRDISKPIKGINIDMKNIKNLTQLLSIVALKAESQTIITNIKNLKYSEIDRIKITCSELKNIGAEIFEIDEDSIKIIPKEHYHGATIDTFNDYRTTMAFSLLGTFIDGISILDEHNVDKIHPHFFDMLDALSK